MKFLDFPYFRCTYMKNFQHFFSFLLVAMLLLKVSAAHVYVHQDSVFDQIENCKICDSAIENQNAEHNANNGFTFQISHNIVFHGNQITKDSDSLFSSQLHFRLFGRPPPSLG